MVVPVGKKVRVHHHRRRRDPRVVDAGVRRQAGRDPGLPARHLVPRRQDRHLSAASAPSSAARSTASCRSWCAWCRRRTTRSGSASRRRRWPPPPTIRARPGTLKELVARGEKVYAANCVACHQAPGQGTPAMKAPALAGSKVVTGPEAGADRHGAERPPEHRDAGVQQAALRHRDRRGHHLHAQFLGQQGERRAARRSQGKKEITS